MPANRRCVKSNHTDVRMKYINKYVENGVLKIIFLRFEDINSDIMTKNLSGEGYSKHSNKLIKKQK